MTELPDGSGFFVGSLPLPKDHWLYASNTVGMGTNDNTLPDLHQPYVLNSTYREEVMAAMRWAIRGATMNGTILDFDPDALVQNATYALCGPCGTLTAAPNSTRNPYPDLSTEGAMK